MYLRQLLWCLLLSGLLGATSCSQPEASKTNASAAKAEVEAEQRKKAEADAKKRIVPTADPKKIEALMPEGPADYVRTAVKSELQDGPDGTTVKVVATYGKEGQSFDLVTVDFAGAAAKISQAYWWVDRRVDQKLKTGYEKTGYVQQVYKSYEFHDQEKNISKFMVCAGSRFVVSVDAQNVPMDTLKATVEKIDFRKLAALK